MRISDFIEASNAAQTPDEVFDLFRRALAEYGYDRLALVAVSPAAQRFTTATGGNPLLAVQCPGDWPKHYFESGYHRLDPVMLSTPSMRQPFFWSQLLGNDQFSSTQKQVIRESEEAGLHNGLAVPLHGPNGESCLVTMATDRLSVDNRDKVGALRILATQFHLAFTDRLQAPNGDTPRVHLTERERECLTWTARGKSAWAISKILGVSENTVNFHLKSVMKKLGAMNRVAAVVTAVRQGLILP